MSTVSKKTIGDMSVQDMIQAARLAKPEVDLPTCGGDYDTIEGWCSRLGIGRYELKTLTKWLTEQGECERRPGYVMRASGPYRCKLIYSKTLGEKAADLTK